MCFEAKRSSSESFLKNDFYFVVHGLKTFKQCRLFHLNK